MSSALPTLRSIDRHELRTALAGAGVGIDYGTVRVRLRSRSAAMCSALPAVYGSFPFDPPGAFSDIHAEVQPPPGLRRLVRPQATFSVDGLQPFEPFAADSALPLYEWGVNWVISQRIHHYLLLHAAVVAQGDRAALLAAPPGSGKSTLSAALMLGGFRLLSDEFGAVSLSEAPRLYPVLKPVALKNAAIDIIRRFSADAILGPVFPGTRKGDVAHLAPDAASVSFRHAPAALKLALFPRYASGSGLEIRPMSPTQTFTRLAFNSFNYGALGPRSFSALAALMDGCAAFEVTYSDLPEVIEWISRQLDDAS